MYWPSNVGTIKPDHVSEGSKNNGPNVVTMCTNNIGITTLSKPRTKNNIPIIHSNTPNPTKNEWNGIKGIVFSKSLCTRPDAGESPITFKKPNQKNTTNRPNRATSTETLRKKCISFASNISTFIKFSITQNTPYGVFCFARSSGLGHKYFLASRSKIS